TSAEVARPPRPGCAALRARQGARLLHGGGVVLVVDRGEVGAAVGQARTRQERDQLVGGVDVQRDPRDVPVTGAEEQLVDGGLVLTLRLDVEARSLPLLNRNTCRRS